MTNPIHALDENFFYNSMLARALVTVIPEPEREVIRIWLDKLHEITEVHGNEKAIRNEYMWFLLLQLQNKHITVPFKTHPPHTELRNLQEILPSHIYEEVLTTTDQNMSWLENVCQDGECVRPGASDSLTKRNLPASPPSMFYVNQPAPQDGIICYLAVFSDQDY